MNTIIFGLRAIIEAIKSGTNINKIYLQKGLRGHLFSELEPLIKQNRIASSFVPVEKLDRLSYNKNHQGAVAQISPVGFYDLEELIEQTHNKKKTPLFVVLDQVSDVRNFGAIARTAECAGVHTVLIPEQNSAALNADAVKTSSGALHKIPICRTWNLKLSLQLIKNSGIQIISCTEETQDELYSADFNIPTAIILGSEEDGISDEFLKMSNKRVKIPINGKISSLNVSVAAGIITYEAVRQRNL